MSRAKKRNLAERDIRLSQRGEIHTNRGGCLRQYFFRRRAAGNVRGGLRCENE